MQYSWAGNLQELPVVACTRVVVVLDSVAQLQQWVPHNVVQWQGVALAVDCLIHYAGVTVDWGVGLAEAHYDAVAVGVVMGQQHQQLPAQEQAHQVAMVCQRYIIHLAMENKLGKVSLY